MLHFSGTVDFLPCLHIPACTQQHNLLCIFYLFISQRSKQTLSHHHFQQHHPGMVAINNPVTSMGHMMEMMSQRHQAPPLQHHPHPPHHHHSQLPAPPLTYNQQRCHAPPAPPQHPGGAHSHQLHQSGNVNVPHAQAHQSPPPHLHQGSPPAPPLSVPPQVRRFISTEQLDNVKSYKWPNYSYFTF